MKYRFQADISFSDEQDAVDCMNYVEKKKASVFEKIAPGEIYHKIPQICTYHKCLHDENSSVCDTYTKVDFKISEETHVTKDAL